MANKKGVCKHKHNLKGHLENVTYLKMFFFDHRDMLGDLAINNWQTELERLESALTMIGSACLGVPSRKPKE